MSEPPPQPPSYPPPAASERVGPPPEPEPRDRGAPPEVSWGPGRALLGLVVLLAVGAVGAIVVSVFDPDLETLGATFALQTVLAVSLLGVAFFMAQPDRGRVPAAALGLRRPLHPAVKLTVLAYLVYIGCALAIAALIQPEQEDITRELGYGEGVLASVGAGLLIVVAAPLTEEVFFRGFLFAGLRRGLPFALAAAISAGIWGLFHFTGADTWGVVLQLSVFGVILAWLYERTGSIWPPISMHLFNNAIAFAFLVS